jgi:hypothetical protein
MGRSFLLKLVVSLFYFLEEKFWKLCSHITTPRKIERKGIYE